MRFFISIVLILILFFQTSVKTAVVSHWKWNQKRITEKYCENKNNPMLHCDGQCYLSKQLKQLALEEQKERNEHQLPENALKQLDFVFLSELNSARIVAFSAKISPENQSFFYSEIHSNPFQCSAFHPPETAPTA